MKRKSETSVIDNRQPKPKRRKAKSKQTTRAPPKPKLSSTEATQQFLASLKSRTSSVTTATVNRVINGETATKSNENTGEKQRSSASIMIVPRSVDTPCTKLSSVSSSSQSEKKFVCRLCQRLVAPMKESAIKVHLFIFHSIESDIRLCCGICRQFIGTELQIETHHRKEHIDVENIEIFKFIVPYVTTTMTIVENCVENAPNGDNNVINESSIDDNKNCDVDNIDSDEDYVSASNSSSIENQNIDDYKEYNNISENHSSDERNFESINADRENLAQQNSLIVSDINNNDSMPMSLNSLHKNIDIIEHNTDENASTTEEEYFDAKEEGEEYFDEYWWCDCGQSFLSESSHKLHDSICDKRPKSYVMTSTPNNDQKSLVINKINADNERVFDDDLTDVIEDQEDLTDVIEDQEDLTDVIEDEDDLTGITEDKIWYCKCGKAFLTSLSFNLHCVLCANESRNSLQTPICTDCVANYTEIKDKIYCKRIYSQKVSVTEEQTSSTVSEDNESKLIIRVEKLPPIDYSDESAVKSYLKKRKYVCHQNTAIDEQNNTVIVNEQVVEKKVNEAIVEQYLLVRVERLPPLDYTDQQVVKRFLQKHNN